ncbi:IclR family transcriptional regulator [Alteribacillus sp. YIM 98480]|uniref:IclR family transcriptional regulator n=1 Tax=Alteribacillus sp. YIM 98480 TaxID=2606599 RepID=UPI00131C65A4|nr:IclR family transcriptional regulator [Alteribacillus sp. YIM 98480]
MSAKESGSLIAQRTLQVLLILQENQPLSLSQIAEEINISRTAAYRIVSTLTDMKFLVKDNDTKKYKLGSMILSLANSIDLNIRSTALPFMEKLSKDTQESVYLSMSLDSSHYIFIEGKESPLPLRWSAQIGESLPTDAGSVGKAHLSFSKPAVIEEIVNELKLRPYTSNTITDREALLAELQEIRKKEIAISKGERFEGVIGISAPIFENTKTDTAFVLSMFIPDNRIKDEDIPSYANKLLETTRAISANLQM